VTRRRAKPAFFAGVALLVFRRALPWAPALVLCGLLAGGCAGARARSDGPADPLEPVNRVTYKLNDVLDRYAIGPVARGYVAVTPEVARTGVSNFFDNITYLNVLLNDLLQAKGDQFLSDFWRLFFNTFLGFGGLYDIATPMGFLEHQEDLGQTFATWGLGEGFYLVLPVFGPSSLRDAPGLATAALTNPIFYLKDPVPKYSLIGLQFVDLRARVDKALKIRAAAALDPYAFTREAYRQRRTYLIYDGHPPRPKLDEGFDEEPGPPE